MGVKSKGNLIGIKRVTEPESTASKSPPGDKCEEGEKEDKEATKESKGISFSVSYFSWTVSSSEDEAEQVTISLDRMKLRRRSSRERNEALKERRDSAHQS